MSRKCRIKNNTESTVYHIVTKTALPGLPIKDVEKDFFVELLKRYSRLYFNEILGYTCMCTHIHILLQMYPESYYTDEEVKKRYEQFYGEEKELYSGQIPVLREKLSDLSTFVKVIKQNFSKFYNKRNNRKGFFWGDRFKSVIVENGKTLIFSFKACNQVTRKTFSPRIAG